MIIEMKKLPGMKRNRRIYKGIQYWVRGRETDLQIGLSHASWYSARSELGTHGSPARGILRGTVSSNISEIQKIQAQYLSALSQEKPSLGGTDEAEYKSPDGPE